MSADVRHAERRLILSCAPERRRAGLAALLALDDRLGAILRSAGQPLLGQMRLTWWAEALARLDIAPPPAEPVLQALAADVLPYGVAGARLADMIDGWERVLIDDDLSDPTLGTFGRKRGGVLFAAVARLLGATDPQAESAGEGWALADLANNLSRPDAADRVRAMARDMVAATPRLRWSHAGRAIGALALLARFELEGRSPAWRIGRLLLYRLTGR